MCKGIFEDVIDLTVLLFITTIVIIVTIVVIIIANAIINIMLQPAVNSASDPNDGVCEDGEGWGCIAEIASKTFTFSSSFQLLMIGMICNHFSDS